MSNTTILRGILLAAITLSLNLSSIKLNGQSIFKKIENAATKVVEKKIGAKKPAANNQNKLPDTLAAAHTDNNEVKSTRVTNPSTPVNAVPNEKLDNNQSQQPKPGENNSSAQNIRNVFVSIWGVDYELQTPLRKYLRDTTKGMYGFQEKAIGMTVFEVILTTSLNTNDLVKTLVGTVETLNPKLLYHLVDTTNEQMVKVTMFDKSFHYITKETKSSANEKESGRNGIASTKPVAADDNKVNSEKDDDKIFTKVYDEASFPGGAAVFGIYLKENLNTNLPKKNGAPAGTYTVIVRFLVAKDGSISDVEALTRPGYGMEKEAIRVIEGGPKWKPGEVNGPVKSFKTQPITFIVSK